MNSPLTTADFADDGLVRYESQTFDPVVDDSSDDDEHAELELENHVEYKVCRMLGSKPDAVKEQLAAVKSEAPFVPQQLHEKSFGELPLEVQTKTVKRLKNINFRYNVAYMTAKGLLAENENGKSVLQEEVAAAFNLVKEKLPKSKRKIAAFFNTLIKATQFPQIDDPLGPERFANAIQGLVLLKDALEKMISYRNVQHANYEFVKIVKLYEKSKTVKKIDAQKQFISELEEDISIWKKRKSLLKDNKDKDRKSILSHKIETAQKDIEGHEKKLAKLQEHETLRRSLRLQKTPRSASKSPRTLTPTNETGGDLKRQRTLSMVDGLVVPTFDNEERVVPAVDNEERVVPVISNDENSDN